MYEYRVVHGLDQALKQTFAILQPRAALLQIFQQFVHGGAEMAQCLWLAFERDASGSTAVAREMPYLVGEFVDSALLPLLPSKEHDQTHRQNGRG